MDKKPGEMTLEDFKAYHDADRLIAGEGRSLRDLKDHIGKYYPEEKTEIVSIGKNLAKEMTTAENIILLIGMLFFTIIAILFAIQFGTGNADDINMVGFLISMLVAGGSGMNKIKMFNTRQTNTRAFSDQLLERDFTRHKMLKEYELQELQIEFFMKEMIQIICNIDMDRLPALEMSLQALVYNKEGVIQREMKELKELLNNVHAAFTVMGTAPVDTHELNEVFEYMKEGVLKLDNQGVIRAVNSAMKELTPNIESLKGKHWTMSLNNCPGDQTKKMMQLFKIGLSGKAIEEVHQEYVFDDQSVGRMRIKVIPERDINKNVTGILAFFEALNK